MDDEIEIMISFLLYENCNEQRGYENDPMKFIKRSGDITVRCIPAIFFPADSIVALYKDDPYEDDSVEVRGI